MQGRTLGRQGLSVSALGFGCMSLGIADIYSSAVRDDDDAVRLIHRCLDLGITFLDTANIYGDSELKVGKALKGRRDGVQLATGVLRVVHAAHVGEQLEAQVRLVAQPAAHRDEVLAAGLLMGANGGIGSFYNLVPELFVRLHAAAVEGRWQDARALQQRINVLIGITLQFPLFPAVKQMLAWSGLDCGTCLPPRAPLDDEQQRALRTRLAEAGLHELAGESVDA